MNEDYFDDSNSFVLESVLEDIDEIQRGIDNSGSFNKSMEFMRKYKKTLLTLKLVFPYLVFPSFVITLFSILGATPFKIDEDKLLAETKKDFDKYNNIKYVKTYDRFESNTNVITYYGLWTKMDDNEYSREVKTYYSGHLTEKEAYGLLKREDLSVESVLGKPRNTYTEHRNNISEEELNQKEYYEATVYSEDLNDFIIIRESNTKNIITTIICFAIIAVQSIAFKNLRSFDYKEELSKVDQKYVDIDVNELTRRLEIREANYERLTR